MDSPVSNFHDNFTDLSGLSFLFIEMKELCEARAKLEMCSNFQIYPWGAKSDPPSETVRGQSEHFTFQCDQWEPIQNSQLIG